MLIKLTMIQLRIWIKIIENAMQVTKKNLFHSLLLEGYGKNEQTADEDLLGSDFETLHSKAINESVQTNNN